MGVKPGHAVMDPSTSEGLVLKTAWDSCAKTKDGPHWAYGGVEAGDPLTLWAFFAFDSVAHHETFAKEHGAEAVKDLPKVLSHPIFMGHIDMDNNGSSLKEVLEGNHTHMILAYFPPTISLESKASIKHHISQMMSDGNPSRIRSAHGWGIENNLPIIGRGDDVAGAVLVIFIAGDNPSSDQEGEISAAASLLTALEAEMNNGKDVLSVARVHVNTRQFG